MANITKGKGLPQLLKLLFPALEPDSQKERPNEQTPMPQSFLKSVTEEDSNFLPLVMGSARDERSRTPKLKRFK